MSKTIYQKTCSNCGKVFETVRATRKTCKCLGHNYTDADKQYIRDNWDKLSQSAIAAHLGIKRQTLNRYISYCRSAKVEGMVLPTQKGDAAIGTIRVRTSTKRGRYEVIKTAEGWKYHRTLNTPPATPRKRARKPKQTTEQAKPKDNMASNRTAYKGNERYNRRRREEDKRMPTRVIDLQHKKRVYIPELKMNVYVRADEDEASVRAKWLGHHENELRSYAFRNGR